MNLFKEEVFKSINYYFDKITNQDVEGFIDLIIKHKSNNIFFLGIGKSHNQAIFFSDLLRCINFSSTVLESSKLSHGDIGCIKKNDLVIIISNSGNTRELIQEIKNIRNKHPLIILLSAQGGELRKICDHNFTFPVKNELSFAFGKVPTLSSLNFHIFCINIFSFLIKKLKIEPTVYAENHTSGNIGLLFKTAQDCLIKKEDCYIVNEETSIKDVILEMNNRFIGYCIVFNNQKKISGLATNKDIVSFINNNSIDNSWVNAPISRAMNVNYFFIDNKLTPVHNLDQQYSYIPVIEDGSFIGIFNRDFYNTTYE